MNWNFEDRKKYILEKCSEDDWGEEFEDPITEEAIDYAISIANEIKEFFDNMNVELEQPELMPCGDNSIDLDWYEKKHGYTFLYNCAYGYSDSAYGDNERGIHKGDDLIWKSYHNKRCREVLVTFAKWCYKREKLSWEVRIKK